MDRRKFFQSAVALLALPFLPRKQPEIEIVWRTLEGITTVSWKAWVNGNKYGDYWIARSGLSSYERRIAERVVLDAARSSIAKIA